MAKQFIFMIETVDDVTRDVLHELLCTGIYEHNEASLQRLKETVTDIQDIGLIEKTG